MRNECDRSESNGRSGRAIETALEPRVDDLDEPGGGVTDLSALASSMPPSAIRETDGASGRVDLGRLVRALHASHPGADRDESPSAPPGPVGAPPVALPVASGRKETGRRTFASGAAVGGFVAAAIALTPLVANVAYAPHVVVTPLDPAPARGRVEHATISVERTEPVAAAELGSGSLLDDDPIAGLDPLDAIEPLDPIEPLDALAPPVVAFDVPAPTTATAAVSPEPRRGASDARALARTEAARTEEPGIAPPAIDPPAIDPPAIDPPAIDPPAIVPAAVASPPAIAAEAPPSSAGPAAVAEPGGTPAPPAAIDPTPAPPSSAPAVAAPAPPAAPSRDVLPAPPASIDQLLESAVPRDEATPAPAPREDALPVTPSREDVDRALEPVVGAVRACAQAAHGTASVRITVAGPTGRVTSAVVEGDLVGTPTGSCVARAVRGAEFRRFQRATFTVQYPFRI